MKDYQQKTAMDLAVTEEIREKIIVYAPHNKFVPAQQDIDKVLQVEGTTKPIKRVANLPSTDYYEAYEHA